MSILKKKTVAGGWCDARRMRTTEGRQEKRSGAKRGESLNCFLFFFVFNLVVGRGRGLLAGFWFIWRMSQRLLGVETEDGVLEVENTT